MAVKAPIRILVLIGTALAFAGQCAAAELKTPLQQCTQPDCGATVIVGRINRSDAEGIANLQIPWAAQIFALKNECLRLRVTAQTSDTELVVVAPGTQRAWRSDGSGGDCPTCPLLKIRTFNNESGWFLVQVNETSGGAVNGDFTLKFARYAASNPNCNSPSTPLPAP
jgi:hypothetical protein